MPYLSIDHVRRALQYMSEHTHPSLMSVLALARLGAPLSSSPDDAVAFGARVERELMEDYFRPVGGPPERPYFIPFGPDRGMSRWRDTEYPGRSLQRQRQDRKAIFQQHPSDKKKWSFAENAQEQLLLHGREVIGEIPVATAYLAVWCYRDSETSSIADLVARFCAEFKLEELGFLPSVFVKDVPPDLQAIPLESTPIAEVSLLESLQEFEPVRADQSESNQSDPTTAVVSSERIAAPRESSGDWDIDLSQFNDLGHLRGLEEPAKRAVAALSAGMHVILTGPPGTGKTQLAEMLFFKSGFTSETVPATDQWTTFDTIGGYFPTPQLDGSGDRLDFLPGAIVDAIEKGHCLIIDEINRADIDKAFGELFTLLTGSTVTLPYRRRGPKGTFGRVRLQVGPAAKVDDNFEIISVPEWWRIVGSMNDSDKASLKRLSMAFVRRFAFIPVDLPTPDIYADLIRGAAAQAASISDSGKVEALINTLLHLFAHSNDGFAKIGMPLGFAFPKSIIKHAESEWRLDGSRTVEQVLLSGFELYVMPQFQGRPDLHEECINEVAAFIPSYAEEFGRHLAVWTGYIA